MASRSRKSRRHRRSLFQWLWDLLTWPFRAIEKAEKSVIRSYKKKRDRFRYKFRKSKVIAPIVETVVWILLLPIRLIHGIITAPYQMVVGSFSGVDTQRHRRQWMHLVQGIPAALVAIGTFVVLLMLTTQQDELAPTYRNAAQQAYDKGNFDRAQLYLQRVLQLGSDTQQTSYLLARTLDKTGHRDRATAILDSLAPDNAPGFPRAHLWKAAFLVEDPETYQSEEKLRRLQAHLEMAESTLKGDPDLDYYLGRFYLAISTPNDPSRLNTAFDHLKRASSSRPELNFELFAISRALGNREEAKESLSLAAIHFQNELEQAPNDTETRMKLAQLMVDSGNYQKMFDLLQEGISLDPSGPMKESLALGYVHRYVNQTAEERQNPAYGLSLLKTALEHDPQCKPALNELIKFGDGQDASAEAIKAAQDMLEGLIAVGESAPLAHFALGVKAWTKNDTDNAAWHLERAYKLDPTLAPMANNLAWVLAFDETNPDPQRAITVINSVIEAHPDNHAYLETRGQILVKLERWEEALDDLEVALETYRQNIQLHESLATIYEHLGQAGLADKHLKVADNLRSLEAN